MSRKFYTCPGRIPVDKKYVNVPNFLQSLRLGSTQMAFFSLNLKLIRQVETKKVDLGTVLNTKPLLVLICTLSVIVRHVHQQSLSEE